MRKKLLAFIHILIILPIVPIIQGCPDCGSTFNVDAEGVKLRVLDDAYPLEEPFNRLKLGLGIELLFEPYISQSRTKNPFVATATATSCNDNYVPNSSLSSIDIWQEGQSITDRFLVDTYESLLYAELDEFLQNEPESVTLTYRDVPQGDSVTWIIKTGLTDGRVFMDTLQFALR